VVPPPQAQQIAFGSTVSHLYCAQCAMRFKK
jgi:hypothetical protein